MSYRSTQKSLCLALFVLLYLHSRLCPQEATRKSKPNSISIEGEWTVISIDTQGSLVSGLPLPVEVFGAMRYTPPFIWKVTKETIELGRDQEDDWFPLIRYTYTLAPGGQIDAIDLVKKNKKGKGVHKEPAIIFQKDDYMLICIGRNVRPKRFIRSADDTTTIYILRRGKLKKSANNPG